MLQFEAGACDSCGSALAFDPGADRFYWFAAERSAWLDGEGEAAVGQLCANARYGVCNWLAPAAGPGALCRSCRHNRVIPDLAVPGVLERWRLIEQAKRRMLYTLVRLGVPAGEAPMQPLVFDFLYDPSAERGDVPQLQTGHAGGVVTLNLIEAEDVARERIRRDLGEPYRTLLGHFRHEVAHYYWHNLVEWSADLGPFRRLFGDERLDYLAALASHYGRPPPADWQESFVSAYATMHPWEDFAETFAHYLHIVDALATVERVRDQILPADAHGQGCDRFDPYTADVGRLVERWIPCAYALNSINRSMGQRDLYPFHLSPGVMLKLDFVHRLIAFAAGRWTPGEREGADLKALIATLGHGVQRADA